MKGKQKITVTLYTDTLDKAQFEQLATAKKIRMAAIAADEKMTNWARTLGVSRQYIYQVVSGKRCNQKIRNFIEARLNASFWS